MVAALVDHLWQSVLVLALLAIAAALARRNAAIVRLWIWRTAAIKFLVPFRVLFILGSWFGYPVRYPGDSAPEYFIDRFTSLANYFTPAQARDVHGWSLVACLLLLVVALVPCARFIHERLRDEQATHSHELARAGLDPDDRAPGLGFLRGLAFTTVALLVLGAPVLAGAVDDRLARHDLLLADSRSLFDADVSIQPAAPGMGQRVRVIASPHGVFVRNASIQDLTALSYGVTPGYVWSDHFIERGGEDWFTNARYDVRIPGRIHDPDRFDTYALRIPVTRVLATRYRLEIYVNDRCQPPCGRYGVAIPEDSL